MIATCVLAWCLPLAAAAQAGDHAHADRLEAWDADPGIAMGWEGEGWIGQDINRFWWRTEGERVDGETEAARLEALYGHAFTPWWDWVVGMRHDFRPAEGRTYAAFGLQGLAPHWFEVSLTGYMDSSGRTMVRFAAEHELLFTNRLILQSLLDWELHGRSDASRGIGAGLATAEAGLRMRYELNRRFAPYVGIAYEPTCGVRRWKMPENFAP
jgi:copper resistance protein B